jgi:hypothetical protein
MIDTNKSQAQFAACDAFLTDLSTHEEATLSGGLFITDDFIRDGIIRRNFPTPPPVTKPVPGTFPVMPRKPQP